MNPASKGTADSLGLNGPPIPGAPDEPAFSLLGPEPSAIPVVIAVPHAGRTYPEPVLARMRDPQAIARRLEDRYVDMLAREIGKRTDATMLIAHAPRAMIDLNRAPDDIDWDMIARRAGGGSIRQPAGRRWRSGLGLIPRRLPAVGEMWTSRHDEAELEARIVGIHQPYHAALSAQLTALRERWGAALLLDLHSMPTLPAAPGHRPAEFVVGDRFGATCAGKLVATSFGHFAAAGRGVAHNRPYAGDYTLHRHGVPRGGIHAMQLEVDRAAYLDSQMDQPGPGFEATVDLLTGLVQALGRTVADMGGDSAAQWAEAAE